MAGASTSERDVGRRLLRHHLPLALASVLVLVAFSTVPALDVNRYPRAEIAHETLPRRAHDSGMPRADARRLADATGYLAFGLVALTLAIGPANVVLRRRNPVSSYLRRDVGLWAGTWTVVHLVPGFEVHKSGRLSDAGRYFVSHGRVLTTSFGLANLAGLAGVLVVLGLLATSSDVVLRVLGARRWKRIQRLNYALAALVVVHAYFYGAFVRTGSPTTMLLVALSAGVLAAQLAGVWRRSRR